MLCTLFLTRYMMPVLYSYFPAPRGQGDPSSCGTIVEGTNYSERFIHYCPSENGGEDS
jgi:cobalt-zinc-cadmium resistance protein CzcA